MPRLTIHTATYNRAYILSKAFDSLVQQTCKDFEWIITDDGSTDFTEELVSKWQKSQPGFPIIYNKLNHVGIPRALNSGIQLANTEWFMMLDSDDYILPETVECIMEWLDEIEDNARFAGIGFAKCQPNGAFMKPQTPLIDTETGHIDATNVERAKYNLDMDMCEVHRTSLFRKYPFQVWENEKYAPEQLNYNQIGLAGYKLRWCDKKLYVCDYLDDGQTKSNTLVKNNPMGFAMMWNQNLLIHKSTKDRFYDAVQMISLSLYAKNPSYLKQTNNIPITILALPLGCVWAYRRKKQFEKL